MEHNNQEFANRGDPRQGGGYGRARMTADAASEAERSRASEIIAIGKARGMADLAAEHVRAGTKLEDFRAVVLDAMPQQRRVDTTPRLGLHDNDAKKFSFGAVMRARIEPQNRVAQEAAAFSNEIIEQYRRLPGVKCTRSDSLLIPPECEGFMRAVPASSIVGRGMTVGTPGDGGYLKGVTHRGDMEIDLLKNRIEAFHLGAQEINAGPGDISVPKITGAMTAFYQVAEDGDFTESKLAFAQVTASPHILGARAVISRKLLLQSEPIADKLVERDVVEGIGIEIDRACFHGTGADGQPTGLELIPNVPTVPIGTTGGAPLYEHIVDLETKVASGNADVGSLAFLTNTKARGKLRRTFANTVGGDTPLWTNRPDGYGDLLGYKAAVSNNVRSDLTKSSGSALSAIYFGNWQEMLVFLWGGLEVVIDPYTLAASGQLRIVAFKAFDIKIRREASFARILDAATT